MRTVNLAVHVVCCRTGLHADEIVHLMDWLPTFLAAAGKDGTKKDLLDGYRSKALVSQRCPARR